MWKLTYSLLFISCLVLCSPAIAETKGGDIDEDEIWTEANSPYILNDHVHINSQVTVMIERGVEVQNSDSYDIDVGGALVAYGVTFTDDINIYVEPEASLYGDGVLDVVGCTVAGSINLECDSTARIKYCQLGGLSISSYAVISITGNDFSLISSHPSEGVSVDGDSEATINLEYNWWGTTDTNVIDDKILDHNDEGEESRPWVDYEPFLPEAPPSCPNDAGSGNLQGRVYNRATEAHITGAIVSVEGQIPRSTDHEGKFSFWGLDAGETTLTVRMDGVYYGVSETVLIGENSTTFVYVLMTLLKYPMEPVIVEIRSRHCNPDRHTYYLDGVDVNEVFTAVIDWGNGEGMWYNSDRLEWIRSSDNQLLATSYVSDSNDTVSEEFNVDECLDVNDRLKVVAIAREISPPNNEVKSDPNDPNSIANFDVIAPPNAILANWLVADPCQSVIFYVFSSSDNWVLNGFLKDVEVTNKVIPGFGGHPFELAARAYATAEIRGDGTASATFLDEHNLFPIEIAGIGIAPTASLDLGWEYDSNEANWNPWGRIGIRVEGSYNSAPNYYIVMVGPVPVPVYWRTGLRIIFDMLDDGFILTEWSGEAPLVPKWDASPFIFEVLAEIMMGVGAADAVAAEGYFGGGAEMHIDHNGDFNDLCIEDVYIKVYGGIRVVVFIFKYDKKGLQYKWKWPGGTPGGCKMMAMAVGTLDESDFVVFERDYQLKQVNGEWIERDDYAKWIPDPCLPERDKYLKDLVPGEEEVLQYNVFPQSQPTIAADDNDLFLAWVYDDPNRDPCEPNSLNRTEVVFSKYESSIDTWTDYIPIDNDDTADFSPQIVTLGGGKALCVWENVNDTLENDANLTDMAAAMEIEAAYYVDGCWTQKQPLSDDNGYLDRSPRIAAADNKAIAVWISNQNNDIYVSDTNQNVIQSRTWDGNWETTKTVAENIGLIVKTALAYNGTQAVYVYELDSDANLGTTNDRELYATIYDSGGWSPSDPCRLTDNNVLDTNPQVMYEDDGDILLVWCKDANTDPNVVDTVILSADINVVDSSTLELINISPTVPQMSDASGAMDFRLAKSSDGRISLVWTERSITGEGIDIFTATYHSELPGHIWSFPYQLTWDGAMERSLAATYAGSGELAKLALAYNKVKISPVPDVTDDGKIDFEDFAKLANHWREDCCSPNWCEDCDLDESWRVDYNDLDMLCDSWLRGAIWVEEDSNELSATNKPESGRVDLYALRHPIRHDLAVAPTDISFSPANPLPGSTVVVSAVVHNVGDFAENDVNVTFFNDTFQVDVPIGGVPTIPGPIPAGGSGIATVEWEVPPIAFEPQEIRVVIAQEEDSNSTNNEASTETMAPDLTVTQINAKRIDPNNVGITARIKNIGGLRAENVSVLICRGEAGDPNRNEQIASSEVSLEADSFYDVRHIWDIAGESFDSAEVPIFVIADSNDNTEEFDEDNNISFALVRVSE